MSEVQLCVRCKEAVLEPYYPTKKYCSHRCAQAAAKKRRTERDKVAGRYWVPHDVPCQGCKTMFLQTHPAKKYCSAVCQEGAAYQRAEQLHDLTSEGFKRRAEENLGKADEFA